MERKIIVPVKKPTWKEILLRVLPYAAVVLQLICIVMGTILFLAHGLDQYDQFFKPPFEVCALPYALVFPIYILLELLGLLLSKEEGFTLCPLLKPSKKRTYISVVAAVIGVVVGLVLFLSQKDSDPGLAAAMLAFMSLPGMLVYFGIGIFEASKEGFKSRAFLGTCGYFFATVVLSIAAIILSRTIDRTWVMLLATLGLVGISSIMLGRNEKEED